MLSWVGSPQQQPLLVGWGRQAPWGWRAGAPYWGPHLLLLLLCCAVLCCAVLCCAVLCCAVSCCIVLCCAALSCVRVLFLCCVVLCCCRCVPTCTFQIVHRPEHFHPECRQQQRRIQPRAVGDPAALRHLATFQLVERAVCAAVPPRSLWMFGCSDDAAVPAQEPVHFSRCRSFFKPSDGAHPTEYSKGSVQRECPQLLRINRSHPREMAIFRAYDGALLSHAAGVASQGRRDLLRASVLIVLIHG